MERVVQRVVKSVNLITVVILCALALLTTADVVGRYVFNKPIRGTYELSELALVVMAFMGMSYTAIQKAHISISMFTNKLSAKSQAILDAINNSVGLVLFALIAWQGWGGAIEAITHHVTTDALKVPVYPVKMFVVLGSILFCLVLVMQVLQSITKARKG